MQCSKMHVGKRTKIILIFFRVFDANKKLIKKYEYTQRLKNIVNFNEFPWIQDNFECIHETEYQNP